MSLSPFYGFSGQEVQGWLPARVGVAESVEAVLAQVLADRAK